MTDLTNPILQDADKAREHLESIRWADGRFCPHCGSTEKTVPVKGKKRSHRPGLYYCNSCKGQFTVTVGTVFERSKVPLNKWLLANYLICSSKKGVSAHQLHRTLGVSYKTAWFMAHRIREGMKPSKHDGPMGGPGKHVEVDETYQGAPRNRYDNKYVSGRGWMMLKGDYLPKVKVVSLVERGGRARSFIVDDVDARTVEKIVFTNIDRKSTLNTDEASAYKRAGREFAKHQAVNHKADEYVRGDATTNTIEGFFSIFKRGMTGVYQHCGQQHLHRYLGEFDFRYSFRKLTDGERASEALKGIEGKRLTYRRTGQAANA